MDNAYWVAKSNCPYCGKPGPQEKVKLSDKRTIKVCWRCAQNIEARRYTRG